MIGLIKKIFGSPNDRQVRRLSARVGEINEIETGLQKLSDDALRAKTVAWKEELSKITDDKELAQRLRGRFGHHPIAVFCDNTRECMAVQLRRGGAGANDADDHIRVLTPTPLT